MKDGKQLLNTWYNIHESSELEWRSQTERQAHSIAVAEILGDKNVKDCKLSDETRKRIHDARERIFRAMIT